MNEALKYLKEQGLDQFWSESELMAISSIMSTYLRANKPEELKFCDVSKIVANADDRHDLCWDDVSKTVTTLIEQGYNITKQ